jgi:hypothetical protein
MTYMLIPEFTSIGLVNTMLPFVSTMFMLAAPFKFSLFMITWKVPELGFGNTEK